MSEAAGSQLSLDRTTRPPGWTRRLIALALVLLICAGIRTWLIRHTHVIARDGVAYIQTARQWRVDPGRAIRTSHYHPGYPATVAGLHALLGNRMAPETRQGWERAGQLVSLAAGLLATAGVWALTGIVFNWRAAPVAAALFGCGQKWAMLGADVLSDSTAVCLQMAAVLLALLALRQLRRRRRRALVTAATIGICAGAGYLVRGEAIVSGVCVCILWLAYALARQVKWRHAVTAALTTGLVCLVCILPYMLTIGGITRKRLPGASVAATTNAPAPIAPVLERSAGSMLIGEFFEAMHPVCGFLMVLWVLLWIVSLRSSKQTLPRHRWRPAVPGLIISVTTAVVSVPVLVIHYHNTGFLSHRYLMFLAALLAPTAGVAAIALVDALTSLAGRLGGSGATRRCMASILILVPMLGGLLIHAAEPLHEGGLPHKAAGLFLRELAGPDGVIFSDNAWVRHYAEDAVRLRGRRMTAESLRRRLLASERAEVYLALSAAGRQRDPATARLLQSAAFDLIAWPTSPQRPNSGLRLYRVRIDKLPSGEPATGPGDAASDAGAG